MRETLLEHIDALHRFILVRVGFDETVAEDVLQQTAAAALGAQDSPDEIRSLEGWLRGVARNMVRRHWRDAAKRNGNAHLDSDTGQKALATLESESPRKLLVDREQMAALVRAIAALSTDDQRLLYGFYRHGRSTLEIADVLGCTTKGVEMKLYRMRARLRDALADSGDS
jgi:RNA polymerase sigma-70 factor (ECF subfamily)